MLPRTYRPGRADRRGRHHRVSISGAIGPWGWRWRPSRDIQPDRARRRRNLFYPRADVYDDFAAIVPRNDIEVIDAAVHPEPRVQVIEAAIAAGKHILSQKPFAEDLNVAQRLVELAAKRDVKIAVNQNGRWAPHFAYARQAVQAGLLGDVGTIDFLAAFDHSWTIGTPFEDIRHIVLYDFAIHWFDMASCLLGGREVRSVYASAVCTSYQRARPPFVAAVILNAGDAQVRIGFNAAVVYAQKDQTLIAGSLGPAQQRSQS